MLKVKTFQDTEAWVVGYNWLKAKPVRSLLCELVRHDPKTQFSVTVSEAVKANPPPLQTRITVKYFEMTMTRWRRGRRGGAGR
jgi:ATP-dependent DNA ligase